MSDEIDLYIDENGIQAVYSDDLAELFDEERRHTRRASHVEPYGDGWWADMRPVGGGVLTASDGPTSRWNEWQPEPSDPTLPEARPFRTREAALAAERAWLDAQMAERRLEAK